MVGSLADGIMVGFALVRTIVNAHRDKKQLELVARSFVDAYVDVLKSNKSQFCKEKTMKTTTDINVTIKGNSADKEAIDDSTQQLISELKELDIEGIKYEKTDPPFGSKSDVVISLGTVIMTIIASGGLLTSVINAVQSWLVAKKNCSVVLEIDGDRIEVTGLADKEQKKLINIWINRHKRT